MARTGFHLRNRVFKQNKSLNSKSKNRNWTTRAWFWCHSSASSPGVTATQPGRPGWLWLPVHKLFLLVPPSSATHSLPSFSPRCLENQRTDCRISTWPSSVVWTVKHSAFTPHRAAPTSWTHAVLGDLDPVCRVAGDTTAGDPTAVWTHGPLPPIMAIEAACQQHSSLGSGKSGLQAVKTASLRRP